MSEYKNVLNRWAAEKLGVSASEIDSVEFIYDEGYCYSSCTYESPSFEATVYLRGPIGRRRYCRTFSVDEVGTFGSLLSELFEIAEREENNG